MERLRRRLFVLLLVAGTWSFFHADLAPLVTVSPATRTPRGDESTIRVVGAEWPTFLAEVDEAARGEGPEAWRCGPEQEGYSISRRLFYRPDEGPFAAIAQELSRPFGFVVLDFEGRRYVLQRVTLADDDFQFGTGYASLAPPDRFFRPWRFLAPWLFGAALLLYVFLPWPKRREGEIAYARWRVVMSDLLSTLLFLPFFGLPFLIIGGSVQTIVVGWPLTIVFWGLAALGLWAFSLAGWCSAFALRIEDEGIAVRSFADWELFPFAEMASFGPALRRSPRWMRVLGLLAALSGRSGGAATMVATGAEYGGLAIPLHSGRTLFLWVTTSLGEPTIAGAERVPKALRKAGVPEFDEPLVFEGFGRALLVPSGKVKGAVALAT